MTDAQKLVAGALLTGAGLLSGNAAVLTVAGGIGVNWSSEALAGLWEGRALAVGAGEPLAKAYQRAIRRAVDHLRGQYPHAGNACTLLPAFDLVAASAGSISTAELPPGLDAAAIQQSLDAGLDGLLFGHEEREVAFLRQHLLPAVARAFHTELEVDDDAWRAWHGRLIEQMAAQLARLTAAPPAPGTPAAPAPPLPQAEAVLAAFADAAAVHAQLRAAASRLEELIRQWEQAAGAQGGRSVTFDNRHLQAGTVVQGGENAYSQSAIAGPGGTANVNTFNFTGSVSPADIIAAALGKSAPPANPPAGQGANLSPAPPPLALARAGLPDTLTGRQLGELQAALLAAFTHESLRQVVAIGLDQSLDHLVSADKGFSTVVFELINWAQRTGRLPDLLLAAHAAVPDNPKLDAFLRSLAP